MPVGQDVRQRAHEGTEVSVERTHLPDRVGPVEIQPERVARPLDGGTGREGQWGAPTPTGPVPGPPPPCGVENALCRFMCMTSTPMSAGRTLPTKALKFAPSR